jgi:hypothetical protein
VLREVYVAIIGKMNSSVSKVFIEGFDLREVGRDRPIFEKEMKTFLEDKLKVGLKSITEGGR